MNVRATRIRPWHSVGLLGTFLLSNLPKHDVVSDAGRVIPALVAAGTAIPGLFPEYRGCAGSLDGRLYGFGITRTRRGQRRARIVALVTRAQDAAQSGAATPEIELAICRELLGVMSAEAAAQGCVSLFVWVSEDSPFAAAFTETGFTAAAREHTFQRQPAPAPEPTAIEGMRHEETADAWDVQQLYRAITPAAVQQAETSGAPGWETPARRHSWRRGAALPERYVVTSEHGLDGRLEIRIDGSGAHRLALMVHPRARTLAAPLIQFALWRCSRFPAQTVRVTVRDHDVDLAAGLKAAGFVATASQLAMVKHLAIRIASKVPDAALDRATS